MAEEELSVEKALDIIGWVLGPNTEEDLCKPEYQYDDELILEIGQACQKWRERQEAKTKGWSLYYFNGETTTWAVVQDRMKQNQAYQLWYEKTKGNTTEHNKACHSFYYLGKDGEELSGREIDDDEEDDFSVSYLLEKSFNR